MSSGLNTLLVNLSHDGYYIIGKIEKSDIVKLKLEDSKNILLNIFSCGVLANDEDLLDSLGCVKESGIFSLDAFSHIDIFKKELLMLNTEQKKIFSKETELYFLDDDEHNTVFFEEVILDILNIVQPLNKKTSRENCDDEFFLFDFFQNKKVKKGEVKVSNMFYAL